VELPLDLSPRTPLSIYLSPSLLPPEASWVNVKSSLEFHGLQNSEDFHVCCVVVVPARGHCAGCIPLEFDCFKARLASSKHSHSAAQILEILDWRKLGVHRSLESSEQPGEIIVDIPSVSNEQHDDSIPRPVNLVHHTMVSHPHTPKRGVFQPLPFLLWSLT